MYYKPWLEAQDNEELKARRREWAKRHYEKKGMM